MTAKAAIVTGASSGIGFEIARTLADEGYDLTVASRRPDRLEAAAEILRADGAEVEVVAGSLVEEATVERVVAAHRQRFGRLDLLINSAGVGLAGPVSELETKHLDLMLDLNLRTIVLFYRRCDDLLRAAGAEHRRALVVNLASITGKVGNPLLAVYGATKAAVINLTEAMNRELAAVGVHSTALCPAYVDTPMTDYVKTGGIAAEDMISTADIAEAVRFLLRLSPVCTVPEISFLRSGSEV